MKFGENLKNVRMKANLSQEELAEKVGVSRQSVSKWETSLAYPEMKHILKLGEIFHCPITDLIQNDLEDMSSFDLEVQQCVVKLKKEQQNRMKILSKVIMILAKIGKIACMVAIPVVVVTMFVCFFLISHLTVQDNELILTGVSEHLRAENGDSFRVLYQDELIFEENNSEVLNQMKHIIMTTSKGAFLCYVEAGFLTLIVILFIAMKLCQHLEKLFSNIYGGRTPFTSENVFHLKKMVLYMLVMIILPNFLGFFFEVLLQTDLGVDYEMFDLIEILFLFSMVYIFQYGLEIQRDSKGIMYEESHE